MSNLYDPRDVNLLPYREALLFALERLKHDLPACPNCNYWAEGTELCQYANQNVRPPAPVIAFGCQQFTSDVPF